MTGEILVVGTFPPPPSGLAVATASVADRVERAVGVPVVRRDVGPGRWRRRWIIALVKAVRVTRAAATVARRRPQATLLSADAGLGLLLQIPLVVVARLMSQRLFVAHHSRAVSERPGRLVRGLVRAAGQDAIHVFPCDSMSTTFRARLGRDVRCLAVSNGHTLAHLGVSAAPAWRARQDRPLVVGHMSNLVVEKGFGSAGRAVAHLVEQGHDVQFLLAGTPSDGPARRELDELRRLLGERLVEVGHVVGSAKTAFLDRIDVFVHVSRHRHECYSIAVWEALAVGVPVVASRVACLNEDAIGGAGVLLAPDAGVSEIAPAILQCVDPTTVQRRSQLARAAASRDVARADDDLARLVALMVGG